MRCAALTSVLLVAMSAYAGDGKQVTVQVVNTQTSERQYSYYVPGTAGSSHTNCDTNATANTYGNSTNVNGTTNCTTTSTPATAPQRIDRSIAQAHVFAIMPNGMHITLWCQAGFRRCSTLEPGPYTAEIKGDSVWMYTSRLDGKQQKIKYHFVGGW
jgi:hypothetical protein